MTSVKTMIGMSDNDEVWSKTVDQMEIVIIIIMKYL